MQLQN